MSYQFSEKQIYVNEHRISYLEGGIAVTSGSILFIHGWSIATVPYQEIINILCQRYHVIAPDLPGFGKSSNIQLNWNYTDYANFLIDFINQLKLKNIHLIGHSLGGGISATLAALMPDIVSSLVLVDSTGIPVKPLLKVLFQRLIEMTVQTPQMKFPEVRQVIQAGFYNLCFKTQTTIQSLLLALEKDIKQFLPQIESPCLIIWGSKDLTTPLTAGKEFSQLIKGSKLVVIEGVYHEWCIFFVNKFTSIVFDFIDEVEAIE